MTLSRQQPVTDLSTFLSETMLFQSLPSKQLADIAQLAIAQHYDKGEILFHQGEAGIGFFVIKSGRVKVFKVSADGREQILHVFGRGDHFAEVPALDGDCFPASAAAIEPSEVLFFARQSFLQLLEQQPTLAINLVRSFARHLRQFSQLVDNLALREVPARLATYLLSLSEQANDAETVELDLTKGQLAARLGTIPETLSRIFAKLNREGIIVVDNATVALLNREHLQHLAFGKSDRTTLD